ncbi:hypothetical protein MASR2M78_01330 [Treponema sp.]
MVGNGMLSLLSDDASLNSLQSLRGKKIEVAGQGATPDYVFRRLLQNAGLDPQKDVELGYSMAYPEMAQALIAGRVSIALLPEPFATMARMGRKTLVDLIDVQKEWAASGGSATYPMTVLVVDSRFAKEHPLALKAIMDAYRSSVEWTKKMPKEAGLLVEKYELGLKSPIATAAIPKSAYVFIDAIEARPSLEALFPIPSICASFHRRQATLFFVLPRTLVRVRELECAIKAF